MADIYVGTRIEMTRTHPRIVGPPHVQTVLAEVTEINGYTIKYKAVELLSETGRPAEHARNPFQRGECLLSSVDWYLEKGEWRLAGE